MKLKNNKKIFWTSVLIVVFVISMAGFLLNSRYCGFVGEMRSYARGRESFYYYGPRYCPATWSLESIDEEMIGDLSDNRDILILSQKESPTLEEALEKKYLSYTRFFAGSDNANFVIYETECRKCKN